MMPVSKHGDPQLGVDIHLCVVPPSPSPVPLPTPHTSIVFDPFDYIPIIGATISVCGMKRATAGTNGIAIHIPPGFPFAPKLPDKDDELFMGSSTVVADGDPFSFIALPVLSCQIAGMMSPFRAKKKGGTKAMVLPTVFNLAIPTTVFVGGPPTISLMGLAFKGAFAALGKFAKSGLFKRIRQKLFKNLNPGFLKCIILRAEPVNVLTGEVVMEQLDFTLPGRIPLEWTRAYASGRLREGACGYGWESPADIRLEVDPVDGVVMFVHPSAGPLFFTQVPHGPGETIREEMDGARLMDAGDHLLVRTKDERIYRFSKELAHANALGLTEYPIARIADLHGNWLDFERRGGQAVAITESSGRRVELRVERGRIVEISLVLPDDGRHTFVRYQYDEAGDLVAAIDALGAPYGFAYSDHHLIRHTLRTGLSFHYEYQQTDAGWRVVRSWGDGGLFDYCFEYDDILKERRITDSLGHVSLLTLDERGLPISELDPIGGRTIFEYDESGRATAVVDADRHRTEWSHDDHGNVVKLTRPDGTFTALTFDADDKVTSIVDPNGSTWRQVWDARGRLLEQVSPLGNRARFAYDDAGQLVAFVNARGARSEFAFDGVGNITRFVDAMGRRTSFAHDLLGNVILTTDPLGRAIGFRYDAKSRLLEQRLPSGVAIRCEYDAEDQLTAFVDENGAVTRMEYFGQGEIARRTRADGHSVQFHYDSEERLVGVTNQRGEVYRLLRDEVGRIVEEVDYWGQSRQYRYSTAGYIREIIDPLGRSIRCTTDPLGRVTKKALVAAGGAGSFEETFEYDPNGNFVVAENPLCRVERTFDAEGRVVEEKQGDVFAVRSVFDGGGNRIRRETELRDGDLVVRNTVNYAFDPLDQAVAIAINAQPAVRIERDAAGHIVREQLSDRVHRQLAYSADGHIVRQRASSQDSVVLDVAYGYDAAGNLTERRDAAFGIDQFVYDPLGQLVGHVNPLGRISRFLLDPVGDRLRSRFEGSDQAPIAPGDAGAAGGSSRDWMREADYDGAVYRFDRAGQLVERHDSRGALHLNWDAGRLVESRRGDVVTRYQYDALGRRLLKQTGAARTRFFWDGDMMVSELVAVPDDVPGRIGPVREYVAYPDSFVPLGFVEGDGNAARYAFYHLDPNGSPIRLTDPDGRTLWAGRHDGSAVAQAEGSVTAANPLRFQGQYEDVETGLYYNRHRYYDPCIAAFVSLDPLGLHGGINPYQYAPNVAAWIDPRGLKKCNISAAAKKALKESKPTHIKNPHMHHIVMEGAFSHWKPENRKLIADARAILEKHKIDLQGVDNVVWAQNAGHSVEYAKKVLGRLDAADQIGKEAVTEALSDIGKALGKGTF